MSFFLYLAPQFHAFALFFYFFLLLKNRFYFSILLSFITKVDFAILVFLNYYFILFSWWFHTMCWKHRDIHPHQICTSFGMCQWLLADIDYYSSTSMVKAISSRASISRFVVSLLFKILIPPVSADREAKPLGFWTERI